MENKLATTKPKMIDIINDDIDTWKKTELINGILNSKVPSLWVSKHPFIKKEITLPNGQKSKVPYEYIPIDKVEFLLRKIWKRYRIEILREGSSFNGVFVVVRVHYYNPVFKEWDFYDGIGAVQLQTKAGSSPADLININNGALAMAYPAAKTVAIKDACDHFGEIFGANLNRENSKEYSMDMELINYQTETVN